MFEIEPTVLSLLRAKSAPTTNIKKSSLAASSENKSGKLLPEMQMISTSIEDKLKYYKEYVFKLVNNLNKI